MEHQNKINAAIQVLASGNKEFAYMIVDAAIQCIQSSGLKYRVCPFETIVEGSYQEVIHLISEIRECCFREGASDILINLKLQIGQDKDITISDKMHKYEKSPTK